MLIAGRFERGEQIGQGGMGTVYHGLDTQTGQSVAIKLLRPDSTTSEPIHVARFARESELLRQLDHPNIVEMLETSELDGQTCIVMEYVVGGNLSHYLQHHGQLPIKRVVGIGLEIADALTRAHHLNIIHRDLKPDNVLLAEDGTPRLTDFGLARMRGQAPLTQSNAVIGTLHYLSPEALHGEELDERADIWSFGVMLYEMLTGIRPFEGQGPSAVLAAILMQPPTPDLEMLRADVPVALVDLIYRMLEKDRLRRIPSVRLIGAELEAIKRGTDLSKPAWLPVQDDSTSLFATPTQPTDAIGHNLPAQLTAFVGRETELTELERLLDDPNVRLITILAPGGMGKTRLGLEVATHLLTAFTNGVYFVPLAPLQTTDSLTPTIAEHVQYQFHKGVEPKQQLLDYFRAKQMLVVLDNFEHLLEGAELVTDILRIAPQVKIIVTSRERLNLQAETLFRIHGLDTSHWETLEEAQEYAAVKLFIQGARRGRPDFELPVDDLKYVELICRLVEGMPLGILLSAAWVDHLSLEEIAGEISQSLDILETGLRDVPRRHRSIRAAIEPTWKRLTPGQQVVFMKLSVFRGGFTRESAQEVAAAGLRDLSVLVNKSLLHRDPASGRYTIHEMLRQYAEEQLELTGAADSVREIHCNFYMSILQRREADLQGFGQITALEQIDADFANVQAAWSLAVDHGYVDLIDLSLEGLALYCRMRGSDSGLLEHTQKRFSPVMAEVPSLLWGRISVRLLSKERSQVEKAIAIAREYDDQSEIAHCLLEFAEFIWRDDGDLENALVLLQESLTIFQNLGDSFNIANALEHIGLVHSYAARHELTTNYFQKSFIIRREIGDRYGLALGLGFRLVTLFFSGDFASTEPISQEALRLLPLFGKSEALLMVHATSLLGEFFVKGKLEESWIIALEIRRLFIDTNYHPWEAIALAIMSCITAMNDDYQEALQLTQAAQLQLDSASIHQPGTQSIVSFSSALVACCTKNYSHLRKYATDAFLFAVDIQSPALMAFYLPLIPPLLIHEDRKEVAAELMGLIFSQPISKSGWASKWVLLVEIRSRLEADLGSDVFRKAWARGESLDIDAAAIEIVRQLQRDS